MRTSFLPCLLCIAAAGSLLAADSQSRIDPNRATTETPFVSSLGMKFAPVPIIGGPTGGQRVLFSVWDTRVQDYEAFVKESKRDWPKPDFPQGPTHPAVKVSWEDAQLFCQWLTARDQEARLLPAGWRYRLPSDHEWSCAVEIGTREDAAKLPTEKNGRIDDAFPWGTQWPPPNGAGNYAGEEMRPALAAGKYDYITKDVIAGYDDGFVNTSPVGSFTANRFGLFDIGGNVWQWCEDWLNKKQVDHVLRGASWGNNERRRLLSSHRFQYLPGARFDNFGVRCVLAVSGSIPPSVDVAAEKPRAAAPPPSEPPDNFVSTIEILSKQAPNALEWALAPLDQTTPPDIRQNLTFLREDMLDEEAKKPAASAAAYKLGSQLCNDLIETLNERDKMRIRAGYTAAKAKVNMGEITNQALEARRSAAAPSGWRTSGAMAWPTYEREKDQREELRKTKENGAALENQRPILEWADRSAQIRRIVDALYAQYRQAARRPREK